VDADRGTCSFLEINARLQVEHPVTEMVTGVDIVREQLRIAGGHGLSVDQDAVRLGGHALEVRINAERPELGFLPSPGLITVWTPPIGSDVRVDTAVFAGWTVPAHYDSLLAKVIARAEGRAGAIARARQETVADRAIGELGPLRYLVCNAANGTFGTLDELTAETWDYTMAAHARALLLLTQRAAASMRENGGGSIVAISSLGARRVYDAYAAFGAAKAAIESLVRYLAVELGPHGIRANCVVGGVVVTDLFRAIPDWESIAAASAGRAPLRTVLDPEDVAEAVTFLLSDAARRVTGQTFTVDAGFTLPG
jgi:NAD(P)-dependent dehydrogenase (short-subunit alcohol dehydrogenase family)